MSDINAIQHLHSFLMSLMEVDPFKAGLLAAIGAIAAMMANRGIAVFHDGLRPLLPEYLEGRMSRKALAATSFALSIGLVVGFGIPFSLAAPIVLVHSLLLGTDMIGIWCANSRRGFIASGIIGALYAIALLAGLRSVVELFAMLPVNFTDDLKKVGDPIVACFALFPAIVVGYQYGYRKGLWVMLTALIGYLATKAIGPLSFGGMIEKPVSLDPNGAALLLSMIAMFYFAMRERPAQSAEQKGANEVLVGLFSTRIERIQKNKWLLILCGGLTASAATMSFSLLAEGPVSLQLMAQGEQTNALLVALARAISFVPLVGTTAIATGVYSPNGMKFVFVAGLATNNPWIAFIAGGITMFIEIQLLAKIAIWLDKYPGVKACSGHIRTAITKMLEVALLVGGMIASNAILPGIGFMIVAGIYLLNRTSRRPLVEMAIGPIATIAVGILANVLYLLGIK
ncbi:MULTISPECIES: YhfT family protein [Xenorhabdus]|uniref:YhfT family protein n=1 Tax=Xenorhabdus aichiensis TaxID=3025874 RepID=A0ABT5LZ10_9GAMM|nr:MULTISPECIES: YhfT family protein [Xenorhabdus]MDC9620656.1 YhfT family protein [Xenorhabdus aichiensis]MDE1475534.1 YhfT family protein [Xenorhabdus bovienii]MDE1482984.1 YhfT family protein [Xenorhabdus bovienii]MDE1487446.1 YhfT family protein [Xenorhabdus bovienii]MDE9430378.1 YhfT family protein [Xenorhabdus bovienii]